MKALVYTAPGTLDYREVAEPVPAAGESLLRVEACCICGSDMHAFHGRDERRRPPLILGHEILGGRGVGQPACIPRRGVVVADVELRHRLVITVPSGG